MSILSNTALAGRTVLVTGAARGIGAGIAQAILEAGGDVALLDLDQAAATATARRLDPDGERTLGLAADVTDAASLEAAAGEAIRRFGGLAGWVNNAGIVRMGPATASRRKTGSSNSGSTPAASCAARRRRSAPSAATAGRSSTSPPTPARSASPTWPPTTPARRRSST